MRRRGRRTARRTSDRVEHRKGRNMTVHRDFMATLCPGPGGSPWSRRKKSRDRGRSAAGAPSFTVCGIPSPQGNSI